MTIAFGLDPSFAGTGWAFVSESKVYDSGVYKCPKLEPFEARLEHAHRWLASIIQGKHIDVVGIEVPFFAHNAKTFFEQAHLVCIYRYEVYAMKLDVHMIHPSQRFKPFGIKPKGGKEHLRKTVNLRYGLQLGPKDHDVSDAIAVGVTALRRKHESR